ncbi:uncharacterized protein LOC110027739 isoform X2 [Phalaenopsis equestris]|uniref:uncharacterized protein LOC110027739 isoform X2 n=1 Tax=Phalaenopsis equestris TaxID=78828 RepID=UPI0009E26254|nr:uncharacterized protein LOC110027739 isoform X2 [Phalaenopsis equestris]
MAKGDISALKEALCNQILITKKLYVELEEEREASATAATEALSMILRLQREKAAEKMEASQYKRMAEERINHAEESLNILEEIIQQKDLEIQSLQFQLKSNKQNKTNLGIKIPDFAELILSENKSCSNGISRRNASFPSLCGEDICSDKRFVDDESPILSSWRRIGENEEDDFQKYETEESSKNSPVGSSCFSVMSHKIQSRSSPIGFIGSWFSTPSTDSSERGGVKSDKEAIGNNENASSLERTFNGKVKYYALFHDLFEVPETHKSCNSGEFCKKLLQDTNFETNSIIRMPEEAVDYLFEDDEHPNKKSMDSDIEQLRRRLQKLEDERVILQEDSESGKKQMREMLKQLNAIETHIKITSSKKSSPAVESSLVSIIEAVLSFSI